MRGLADLWYRLRALMMRAEMDRELDEEISQHLERETDKLIAQGMDPVAARREAIRRFGGVERHRDRAREARGARGVENLFADARLASRRMARSPGFTGLAVLTLALGVGGTSAMFAIVDALLIRSLPYPESDRLVWITSARMITPQNLDDWRLALRSTDELAGFDLGRGVLSGRVGARSVTLLSVSDQYLRMLGGQPTIGRLWNSEDLTGGEPPVAVVSNRLYAEELGGGDIGSLSVTVDETTYDVIGVLPDGFHNLGYEVDLWVPLASGNASLNVVARLRPGASASDAQAEADALLSRLAPPRGADRDRRRAAVTSVRERFIQDVRAPALILFGAAGLVLVLASANVSSLLLGRAVGRAREIAVRNALGAPRIAIVRQLLVEAGVLAFVGGLAGIVLSGITLRGMLAVAPPYLGRALVGGVHVDPKGLGFALVATVLATLVSGVAPALTGTRLATRSTGATALRHARRWHEALVVAEVALALVLLVGAALLFRTYVVLRPSSPGFAADDRMVMELVLPDGGRPPGGGLASLPSATHHVEFVSQLLRRIETLSSGVRAAAVASVPLSGNAWPTDVVALDGQPTEPEVETRLRVDLQPATSEYLALMEIPLVAGRGLDADDGPGAPMVAVVNESAARRLWPDISSPLGRTLSLNPFRLGSGPPGAGGSVARPVELTVVGVVGDVRSSGSHTGARPEAYVSYAQIASPLLHVVVHDPRGSVTARQLRAAVGAVDATVPVNEVTSMERVTSGAVAQQRYEVALMLLFGGFALFLALIGCYGVMSQSVTARRREFGVRMALGATRVGILRDVLHSGARLALLGLASGGILAMALTRVLESRLYGISATDPVTYLAAALMLGGAILAAACVPALRAAGVEPVRTLRPD